jgi:hypothetical protein
VIRPDTKSAISGLTAVVVKVAEEENSCTIGVRVRGFGAGLLTAPNRQTEGLQNSRA